ncbi:heavy metal translocating P-type ATPase [Anaerococcus tetradius]|uniref:Copper-exporting P-type ATPase n=1 Tax=Anaerococcus tetradius ATCC 35098 TaxID=525255 RepID=C2CFH8_9FIRM|nr:heavy metal translocating P-type ATPase [Anaerococcus tetradius]EEI83677.1 copper-exporting ATPase [Anaerococcus tetradius ATCC 35098]
MKKRFDVSGMTCAACQANVQKAVEKLGVDSVNVNLISESMTVNYDPSKINKEDIIKAVVDIGYGARPKNDTNSENTSLKEVEEMSTINRLKISFAFLIPLMYISMGEMINLPIPGIFKGLTGAVNYAFVQFLLAIPVIFINRKFFISGFKGLIKKAPNMDTLVALGSSAACIFGIFAIMRMSYAQATSDFDTLMHYRHNIYFESSATILTLITLGKYFEARSKGETKSSLKNLMELAPKRANIIKDGVEKSVDVSDLVKGDIVLVRPGEAIPVDGIIIEGSSLVDQSAITGESIAVNKGIGDEVISASINKQGSFKFKASRVGEDTTISQIISLVNDANETKAPIARIADKVAAIFVPLVIVIAIATFVIWTLASKNIEFALNLMIAVLVISCPCALGLATPMAIMVATGKSAQLGLLFKNAESLENLHKTNTILLDKTGTITEGKPVVTDVATDLDEKDFLEVAYSIEINSEHPLSSAIVAYAKEKSVRQQEVNNFKAISGLGISGQISDRTYLAGNERLMTENNISLGKYEKLALRYSEEGKTSMYFSDGEKIIGLMAAQDIPKESSRKAIRELKNLGYELIMLTGDNERTAEAIRKDLAIDKKFAQVLPQDKDKVVRKLQKEGKKVTMVGDGINDAPALARADIGVAIASGTDIAIDSCDVVLIKNSLLDLVESIKLSQMTIKIIKENLFWAFFYNIILIPIAAGLLYPFIGLTLNPMFAALAMSMSSVFVCLNSLRLRSFKANNKEEKNNNEEKEVNEKEIKMSELNKMIVKVDGMMCENCAKHVSKALISLAGIENVDIDLANKEALVDYFGSINEKEISDAINEAGYEYKGIEYK